MFVSLSKTFTKFCGFRFGLGIRITKNNAIWALLMASFVCVLQMMWYMLVLFFWIIYALFYGIIWCVKAIARKRRSE